jgi:hypothetical protein
VSTQEVIALGLVGTTAAGFVWRLARGGKTRRRGCCGCPGAAATSHPRAILLKARKNEPVRILIK